MSARPTLPYITVFCVTQPRKDPKELAAIAEYEKEEAALHAAMLAYTPSQEDKQTLEFFGRRNCRKSAGQDPDKNPELFTPYNGRKLRKFDI